MESLVASENDNRSVMVWDVQTGERKAELQGHFAGFSSDGQLILTISDGKAYVTGRDFPDSIVFNLNSAVSWGLTLKWRRRSADEDPQK